MNQPKLALVFLATVLIQNVNLALCQDGVPKEILEGWRVIQTAMPHGTLVSKSRMEIDGKVTIGNSRLFFVDDQIGYEAESQATNEGAASAKLRIANEHGFFGLARPSSEQPWQLFVAEPPSTERANSKVPLPPLSVVKAPALKMNRESLYELAIGGNATFDDWKDNAVSGRPELTSFQVTFPDEIQSLTLEYKVVINRDHSGRIESCQYTVSNGSRGSRELTYGSEHPLFPLTDILKVKTAGYGFTTTAEMVELDTSEPNAEVFELEHYGLATPSFGQSSRAWIYAVVLVVGLVAGVIYLWMRGTARSNRG
jgi:hypothetical protein